MSRRTVGRGGASVLRAVSLAVAPVLALTAGCGAGGSGGAAGSESSTVTVFAAASLSETFTEIAELFEQQNEGVTVRLSFGGSAMLAEQITSGAPADVFASADAATMDTLGELAVDPQDFATNTLQIAVPQGNQAGIATLADLAADDVRLVICAPEVPCGAATQAVTEAAGLTLSPVSQEQSVTDVLGKVSSGEADAGVVYRTDVAAAGGSVQGVPFEEATAAEAVNTYPIAEIDGSSAGGLAREFIDLVLSEAGQAVLTDAGFGQP